MAIFFTFSPTSNHLHPLQVENCDSNSRLVVDEDDNGKFRLERVNPFSADHAWFVNLFPDNINYNLKFVLLLYQITGIENEMCFYTSRFANVGPKSNKYQ